MEKIDRLLSFLEENPNDSFVQHAPALEYMKVDDLIAAHQVFRDLLNANPDYVGSYYQLGKLYERMGERQEAMDVYEFGMDKAKEHGDNHA
ncbi:MAG: hypothetical protein IPH58_18320 [Sphingobacteriales bacterium]|nr:hypothetical protein [Sphingobacteriales bacterium]